MANFSFNNELNNERDVAVMAEIQADEFRCTDF